MIPDRTYNKQYLDVIELNKRLNAFSYGTWVSNGFSYMGNYGLEKGIHRTIHPNEFIEHKIGVCWDYVNYEAFWFDANVPLLPYRLYYIEYNKGSNTHTWLTFKTPENKIVLFESCLNGRKGIFAFKTEKDMLDYYCKELVRYMIDKSYSVFRYVRPSHYGMNAEEFKNYIYSHGQMVRDSNGYSTRYIEK